MTTLTDHMADYVDDVSGQDPTRTALAQRAYMAGAMQALLLLKSQAPEHLLSEVVAYGRTVGTALETARISNHI